MGKFSNKRSAVAISADNTIAILETNGKKKGSKEYRVAHVQALENYKWDEKIQDCTNDHDVWIKNARYTWANSKVYKTQDEVMKAAKILYDDCGYVEYGICFVEIPRKF